MKIGNKTIAAGKDARIDLDIARLPIHLEVKMPVYVYRAKAPGPTLLLTAGIHGDEFNGTETLRRMIMDGSLKPETGTVIAIPIVNIYGFLHHTRSLPDGKDLNRSFPGGKTGSLARRIADVLMTQIIPLVDIGVDFHTGGDQISNFPQTRCVLDIPENRELAMQFGAPLTINSNLIPGSFRKEAWKKGKSILVFEGGQSQHLDEYAIAEGIAGTKRLMQARGLRNFGVEAKETSVLKDSTWVRAKISGMAVPMVKSGDKVKLGQRLFSIGDPFGEVLKYVKSPGDGMVLGINRKPVVNAGAALIHLGAFPENGFKNGSKTDSD
ncbi:MAG: succinylglutamate desuccinylase/aspartoacylase family protein [Bacteroidia bacterium]|nr:succinylglutamate desuccinylase/aspartoacylase family protein [Bacteroidia bacterium]